MFPPNYCAVPRVLNCGCCLIGGVKFVEFPCKNVGLSGGTFCIIPKNKWPPSDPRVKPCDRKHSYLFTVVKNETFTFWLILCFSFFIQSVARTYFSEQPPFAISPSLFTLQPGEAIVMEVSLFWRLMWMCRCRCSASFERAISPDISTIRKDLEKLKYSVTS